MAPIAQITQIAPMSLTHRPPAVDSRSALLGPHPRGSRKPLGRDFRSSTEEQKKSSELRNLSSEVSFHSSELLFPGSVGKFRFLVSYLEIPPEKSEMRTERLVMRGERGLVSVSALTCEIERRFILSQSCSLSLRERGGSLVQSVVTLRT